MTYITPFISIIFCALLAMAAPSQAKDLSVGLGDLDYPPFYFEKNGHITGAAIEIAQYISQRLGHRLVLERYPWQRTQLYLRTGDIDMVILYFKTPEREKDVVFTSIPHLHESSHLFVAKGTTIPYKGTLNGLHPYVFGNVRGYSHGDAYNSAKNLKKHSSNNEESLIKMLTKGRIDIAIGNKPAILMHAKKIKLHTEIAFLDPPIDRGPNYFAFSKEREDAEELAKTFSAEVEKFIASDEYQRILDKYGFDIHE